MSSNQLPISSLIDVQVVLSPQAAQAQDISTLLVLSTSSVIPFDEGYRAYYSATGVATDFGVNSPEYACATQWFGQIPKPRQMFIGPWGTSAATAGKATSGDMSSWVDFGEGVYTIGVSIDGAANVDIAADLTGTTNITEYAAAMNAYCLANTIPCTVSYDAVNHKLVITSNTTGPSSSVVVDPGAYATELNFTAALGAIFTPGTAGVSNETAVEAVNRYDQNFGQLWYAVTFADSLTTTATIDLPGGGSSTDGGVIGGVESAGEITAILGVAAAITAMSNRHIFGLTTRDPAVMTTGETASAAARLKAGGYNRAIVAYTSSTTKAICGVLAKLLTVDYAQENSTITLMYKQVIGLVAENMTPTQANAVASKNAVTFAAYDNNTSIVQFGKMSGGYWADVVTGTDWAAVNIQTTLWNILYQTPTKIPQTDPGVHRLVAGAQKVCKQAVYNGLAAPGVWNSDGFGTLNNGDYLAAGYYVYAQSVDDQSQADREARICPPIQIALKLAGAVHSVQVTVNVNQ